jgi:P27 family predicted phage terminase small subunit
MGSRGPAPTPTRLKLLRGETRPSRLKGRTPEPRPGSPVMPEGMSAAAGAVWARVLLDYGPTGVLTAVDADGLRAYCEAVDRYAVAAQALAASGPLVRGARAGELIKNPLHQIVRDNADLIRAWARELGLTPAARVGLAAAPPDASSPMAQYLARDRRPPA